MSTRTLMLLIASACALSGQELLDRIAVTVGQHVITESEVYGEIRMTAFLNQEKPDFSPGERRKAAERLIEQYLIRREMQTDRYPEPENSEADKMLAQLIQKRLGGSQARYQAALKQYGITQEDVKATLLWQLTALRFTDLRFQPNLQQAREPLREHLEKQTEQRTSAKAAAPAKPERGEPKTDNAEDYAQLDHRQTERNALPQNVDQELAKWLDEARKHARVEYRKEAFQ